MRGVRVQVSCPAEATMHVLGRKWKTVVLWKLQHECHRFNELQARIPGLSHKVLIEVLRELTRDGLVAREVAPSGPRHVAYTLTPLGESLRPVLDVLNAWGEAHDPTAASSCRPESRRITARGSA